MATIRFNVSREDATIIEKIVDRAIKAALEAGWMYDPVGARMDLTACHCNGTPLKLAELLAADDFNFNHDVFGIRRNLDRTTGKLMNHFCPRYAEPPVREAPREPIDRMFQEAADAGFKPVTEEQAEAMRQKLRGVSAAIHGGRR